MVRIIEMDSLLLMVSKSSMGDSFQAARLARLFVSWSPTGHPETIATPVSLLRLRVQGYFTRP